MILLAIPELAAKFSEPFTPAVIDEETGEVLEPATAKCCTSDITLEEFKMLSGKMDGANFFHFASPQERNGPAQGLAHHRRVRGGVGETN